MDHEVCRMWNPHSEEEVLIDKKIAPLIWIIWNRLGFQTLNSCQDNLGWTWINFDRLEDLASFLSILAQVQDEDRDLYHDIRGFWRYNVVPKDLAAEYDLENDDVIFNGPSKIFFPSACLRFPKEDLDRVMEVLRSRL